MPSSSNPQPLVSSNNKGHQALARHNQPLGMTPLPMSYTGLTDTTSGAYALTSDVLV
jgi:hypothetical protein